ncbi:MAG: hypothetical protein GXP24_04880 [Planctomycetes bacterium]|nr:hypothetical protein [Planctomycetota bacterium]
MLGQHLIFTGYGFWLPNDPRGSGSTEVRAQHLYEIGGPATKVNTPRSVAHRPHDHALRIATKAALKRPPVTLNGIQARAVGRGIGAISVKLAFGVYACAVMPDHVHVVVGEHELSAEDLVAALKRAATREMNTEGIHPLAKYPRSNGRPPTPWAAGAWKVFLNSTEAMRRAIAYVEQNPTQAGLKRQRWSFVERY